MNHSLKRKILSNSIDKHQSRTGMDPNEAFVFKMCDKLADMCQRVSYKIVKIQFLCIN